MFSGSTTINQYTPINLSIWFSMAFQAGAINAGGLLACHRTVTHVTGFATYFGVEFSRGNLLPAMGLLSVPGFFLAGSMISAFFVDSKMAEGKQPRYHYMFALISVAMLFVAFSGKSGFFGNFGEPLSEAKEYLMLAILCLCSGIQNACITSASDSVVRTTHLTGITTDLGIGLVRFFSGRNIQKNHRESQANVMRFGVIASFILGSTAAAYCFYHFDYYGFLGPAFISFLLTYVALTKKNKKIQGSSHPSKELANG